MRVDDLTGMVFGRLTGVRRVENRGRRTIWLWKCECGGEKSISAEHVKSGHTVSCGCYAPEVCRKHGHAYDAHKKQSRTYKVWANMRARVRGQSESYKRNYADRGIGVCAAWDASFEAFLNDMGVCPVGFTIDRIDNDGDYCPDNCRWATPVTQTVNRRMTLFVTIDGEKLCLKHACERVGVLYDTAIKRIRRGLTPQEALSGA